jgi:hypothetical protein
VEPVPGKLSKLRIVGAFLPERLPYVLPGAMLGRHCLEPVTGKLYELLIMGACFP